MHSQGPLRCLIWTGLIDGVCGPALDSADFGKIIEANIGDDSNVGFLRHIQLALKLLF